MESGQGTKNQYTVLHDGTDMKQNRTQAAIRRCGELLKQVEPKQGANQNIHDATDTKVLTRTQAATVVAVSPYARTLESAFTGVHKAGAAFRSDSASCINLCLRDDLFCCPPGFGCWDRSVKPVIAFSISEVSLTSAS